MAATLRDDPPAAKPATDPVRYADRVSFRPSPSRARRAAWALALTPAVLVATAPATASAVPPTSWENTPHVSPIYIILVLGGIPVALFVLITLLVYVPSMSRGSTYHPGEAWRGEAEWFGGPRGGLEAVDAAPRAVSGGGRPSDHPSDTQPAKGGTSGQW
jgi:hypothetical protein